MASIHTGHRVGRHEGCKVDLGMVKKAQGSVEENEGTISRDPNLGPRSGFGLHPAAVGDDPGLWSRGKNPEMGRADGSPAGLDACPLQETPFHPGTFLVGPEGRNLPHGTRAQVDHLTSRAPLASGLTNLFLA